MIDIDVLWMLIKIIEYTKNAEMALFSMQKLKLCVPSDYPPKLDYMSYNIIDSFMVAGSHQELSE